MQEYKDAPPTFAEMTADQLRVLLTERQYAPKQDEINGAVWLDMARKAQQASDAASAKVQATSVENLIEWLQAQDEFTAAMKLHDQAHAFLERWVCPPNLD